MGRINGSTLTLIAGVLGLAVLPSQVHGQAQPRAQGAGLEVTAGYNVLGGDDFDGIENALGFETIGSWAWMTGWELGVGAGIAFHDLEGDEDASADKIDIFAEGRYRFGVPAPRIRHFHPFVSGRLGYTRLDVDAPGGSASQDGVLFGAGGGVEYWLTDEVGLLGAGMLQYVSYGDSDEIPFDRSGTDLNLRAGMKLRF